MKQMSLIGVLTMVLSGPAWGDSQCGQFENAIDFSLKRIAMVETEGDMDNSAPRETNRLLKINNEWQLISASLSLMAQNKCPPISSPLASGPYLMSAAKCIRVRLLGELDRELGKKSGENKFPECNTANWKKGF